MQKHRNLVALHEIETEKWMDIIANMALYRLI
jgi:hypothetical protein